MTHMPKTKPVIDTELEPFSYWIGRIIGKLGSSEKLIPLYFVATITFRGTSIMGEVKLGHRNVPISGTLDGDFHHDFMIDFATLQLLADIPEFNGVAFTFRGDFLERRSRYRGTWSMPCFCTTDGELKNPPCSGFQGIIKMRKIGRLPEAARDA